jgi:hypothetical protein
MDALWREVVDKVVCSPRTDVVWNAGKEDLLCLGSTWPLPLTQPLLVEYSHVGGQRVVKEAKGFVRVVARRRA